MEMETEEKIRRPLWDFMPDAAAGARAAAEARAEFTKKAGIPLSTQQYQYLNRLYENGAINDDDVYKMSSAIHISNMFGVTPDQAYGNLEGYRAAMFANDEQYQSPKSMAEGFADSWRISRISGEMSKLGNLLLGAEKSGDEKEIKRILSDYTALEEEAADLARFRPKGKWFLTQAVNTIGQTALESASFSLKTGLAQLGGSIAGGILGGVGGSVVPGVGTAAGIKIGSQLLGSAAAFAVSANDMRGLVYLQYRAAGLTKENAEAAANVAAVADGVTELFLGNIASFGKNAVKAVLPKTAAVKTLAAGTSKNFFRKLASGSIAKTASGKFMLSEAGRLVGEGAEETVQTLTDELTLSLAAALQEEYVDTKTAGEIAAAARDSFAGGFKAAIGLGLPNTIVNATASVREVAAIRSLAAASPDKETFLKKASALKGADGNPVADGKTLEAVYEKESHEKSLRFDSKAIAEVTDFSDSEIEDVTEAYGEGENAVIQTGQKLAEPDRGEIYREDDGALAAKEYSELDDAGTLNIRFYAGDRSAASENDAAAEYGYIKATEKDGVVNITEFAMKPRYEDLRGEVFSQFAEKHAGQEIVWNPKYEQNIALRQKLAEANPRGAAYGLNYYDGTKQPEVSAGARRIAAQITRLAPGINGMEAAMTVEAFNFMARPGETLDKTFERLGIRFTERRNPDITAAQREGKTVKGAAWVQKTAEGMKRFIYVNRNAADPSTIAHELAHVAAGLLTAEDVKALARAMNGYILKDGTVVDFVENTITPESFMSNREQQEAFAEGLENYLATGTPPSEETRPLFEKIKQFIKRLYDTVKSGGKLSAAAEAFYQKLFRGELGEKTGPRSREAARGGAQTEKTVNDTDGAETARDGAETARDEARQAVINDPAIPLEDKAAAVFDIAGETFFSAEYTDNERMNEKISSFTKKYWEIARNHKKGEQIPHDTVKIGNVTDLQKKVAEMAGLDISMYTHAMSSTFVKHVYDHHSDIKKEKTRGNTAITEKDLLNISEVLNNPDYVITGIIFKNEQRFIYGKINGGTAFVFEQPQSGNKALSIVSFYKSNGIFSYDKLIEVLSRDKRFDFSKAKVIDGMGGNPHSNGGPNGLPAVASSAEPSINSLSPDTGKKSSPESSGGAARVVDIDPSVIVDGNGKAIDLKNTPALRKWVLKQYEGIAVEIKDDGTIQVFTNDGIRASFKRKSDKTRSIYANITSLLENAVYDGYENSDYDPEIKETEKHKNIEKQNIYYAAARIGTQLFSVRFKIDVFKNEKAPSYKDHRISEIKIEPSLYRGINTPQTEGSMKEPQEENTNTLASKVSLDVLNNSVKPSYIAGNTLFQTGQRNIIDSLIEDALNITDPEEQERVIGELRELERMYPTESNQYLAPNGKPSLLIETLGGEQGRRAWYAVRTPSFKKWFGDWERIARLEGIPVKSVTSKDIKISGRGVIDTALKWIKDNPIGTVRTITIDGIFDIEVTPDGIQDSLSHLGKYPNKVYVLPALKDVLERGAYIGHAPDIGGKPIENFYFAAPVEIDGHKQIVYARVRENEGRPKQFYVHEVFTEEEIKKSEAMQTSEISKRPPRGYASDIKSLLHGAYEVKNISAVRNPETGEPLPVFHGTGAVFDVFNNESGLEAYYFTAEKPRADTYAKMKGDENGIVMQVFLDIKKPVDLDAEEFKKDNIENYRDEYDGATNTYARAYAVFSPSQIKSATANAGTYNVNNLSTLFQTGQRDIVEEAARYPTWEEWRDYVLYMEEGSVGEYDAELRQNLDSDEKLSAWFKTFHENAVKAVNSRSAEDSGGGEAAPATPAMAAGHADPAAADREFLELIKNPAAFDEFLERAEMTYNNTFRDGAIDEEEAAAMEAEMSLKDDMRRVMAHTGWTSLFQGGGRIATEAQRKRLLGLIRKNPRDYRGIYARVMDIPELAVSAEDSQAARLKYELADSRRENIDRLSPEKLRELADQNEVDEFAEQLRTGRAKLSSEAEKRYIKQQDEQIKELREDLEQARESNQENMDYLARIAGRDFMAAFDRAVQSKENISFESEKLERAIRRNGEAVPRISRVLKGMKASYGLVVSELEALARVHKLEIDVQAALNHEAFQEGMRRQRAIFREEVKEKVGQQKEKDAARLAEVKDKLLQERLEKRAFELETRARLNELYQKREARRRERLTKRRQILRIFRRYNARDVDHEQGRAIALIQNLFKDESLATVDRFISPEQSEEAFRELYDRFLIDTAFRNKLLKHKPPTVKTLIEAAMKKPFNDITRTEKNYVMERVNPDSAKELSLYKAIYARHSEFSKGTPEEIERVVREYLPDDVYYRIGEKELGEWTITEAEELAGIIDNIYETGRRIRLAKVEAENRRLEAMKAAIAGAARNAVPARLIDRPGDTEEERLRKQKKREELFTRYGVGGTAEAAQKKRRGLFPVLKWNDMDNARFAEYVLDNGKEDGVNKALLVRRSNEAYNKKTVMSDKRRDAVMKLMENTGVTIRDLYKQAVSIDMGGDIGFIHLR